MSDTLAQGLNDALGKLILTDVEILDLVERFKVLEEGRNSRLVLDRVALESEGDQVWRGRNHLGELEGGLRVEVLVLDLDLLLLYSQNG